MQTIRDYLCREAQRITDRALTAYPDAGVWEQRLPEQRRLFREMMGLGSLPTDGSAPKTTVTGVVERPGYRIEKLYYESLPGLYVTANLYLPNGLTARAPAVLFQCGHGARQKVYYQAHPRRFAQLGFVCLLIETVQLGEVAGYHHGPYREGWFHWYSRGYTPAGIELFNAMRALDLLAQRPEVDASRLGATGPSGGGAATWWVAAADERVRAAAPSCATATLASHIQERTVDEHCDCMWWINTERWDLADVGALIAPRPLLIASADRDAMNTVASIRQVHTSLERLYQILDAPSHLRLVETPGPHAYHPLSRTEIFSWFLKHLQGRDMPPAAVGDIDASLEAGETEETLRVFTHGVPPENHTASIHEELFCPPEPPQIASHADLERSRERVLAALRRTAFAAFPAAPPLLDVCIEMEFRWAAAGGFRFAYTSEEGWRLHGRLVAPDATGPRDPIVVTLRRPSVGDAEAAGWASGLPATGVQVAIEPRGTGDTAWGGDLAWHLRRAAAWTGRTLASLRAYDTLRALEAVRSFPIASGRPLTLAAEGEMAAIALYAALLDGGVDTLILDAPPATQDAPSQPAGTGPAIEMLACLRVTDLAQVAGLLYPAEIIVMGDCPPQYAWAEALYGRLGQPDRFRRVPSLAITTKEGGQ